MRFAIWSLDLASRDSAFFKHCFYCKNRSLKRVFYLLFFVNRENEIVMSVIRDPLYFLFVNHARDPPCTTLFSRRYTTFVLELLGIHLSE